MMVVAEMLGGEKVLHADVRNEMDLTREIRKGLPAAAVEELAKRANLSASELERIVSRKTLARIRLQRNKLLSPELSDKVARYARTLALAEEVFGDQQMASEWLRTPNRALEGSTPFELIASDAGARLVETIMGRLAHGVFS